MKLLIAILGELLYEPFIAYRGPDWLVSYQTCLRQLSQAPEFLMVDLTNGVWYIHAIGGQANVCNCRLKGS